VGAQNKNFSVICNSVLGRDPRKAKTRVRVSVGVCSSFLFLFSNLNSPNRWLCELPIGPSDGF
jgi:hypothetical protein